ncbi:prolipoprotein diacylglyceryl transferase [Arthrobacter pityocampae]|uniref:Phosphatidylglycerol--prolipoprotein diacylglyceryl transferase n=1 Tax=Arthrobacter pityocampae TaxID=547334 RepID=A0A2S5IZS1_9MICC|nr:prolipoprotein diacylglyceryl transferase [Arthrobacter pityocampae]PPB50068.1 prolipoprotein diacylglyceryl transferase [Arthrobacter pityocampae]
MIGGRLAASIPSPPADWASFSLGPVTIHAYALCILAGIILALLLTQKRFVSFGGHADAVWDIAIWAIPFGIVGGRLYHVVSSPDAYFGPDGDLARIPQIWQGGLGIWGAIALGAVGAWIGARRAGVKLSAFADAAAPGVLLAQAVGRLGNWFNQELFGSPTTLPWGLEIDADNANFPPGADPGTLFHPTFLYELLWNLAGVGLLLLLSRKITLRGGRMFWLYAAYYTLGRVWIEALRIDDAEMITLFGITQRLNVWTSIAVFLVSVAILLYLTLTRDPDEELSVYLPGRAPADAVDDGAPTRPAGDDASTPATETPGGTPKGPGTAALAGSAGPSDTAAGTASDNASATGSHASDTGQGGQNRRGNLSETDGS